MKPHTRLNMMNIILHGAGSAAIITARDEFTCVSKQTLSSNDNTAREDSDEHTETNLQQQTAKTELWNFLALV